MTKRNSWTTLIGALALAGASSFAVAQAPIDWADIEGRIQYAYYTNDVRALNGVLDSAALKPTAGSDGEDGGDVDPGTRAYFRALAHYRLAQVFDATKKGNARRAIGDCADQVDKAVDTLPVVKYGLDEKPENQLKRAEAYALGVACTLAGREMSSIPFTGGRIGSRVEDAVKIEPKNPRVRLAEALSEYERAGKKDAEKAAAIRKLRAVTVMFEQARARASTTPEWGAAEAYAFLARALIDQRDVVGAREALERALLIAPDYALARNLMSQITR